MSDEYQTAYEESSITTPNSTLNNSTIQQNIHTTNNVLSVGQSGIITSATTMAARKQMTPVDQAEPAKPLSAYALFFRDTVSAIKQQNASCSFHELSKIVASMWDALDPVHKGVYNKKNEQARTEYLKQIRIYQQQQLMKQEQLNVNANERLQNETNVQQSLQPSTNNVNDLPNTKVVNNTTVTANNVITATTVKANSSATSDGEISLITEAGSVENCLRDNCNKRAVMNPDWEDEYCSNECVILHCRNVFNAWVQSNLQAKQQRQTHQPAQQSST